MRFFLLVWIVAATFPAIAQSGPRPGMGHAGDGPHACLLRSHAAASCVLYDDPRHGGCGKRHGPGCRKANGRCASWRERIVPDCRMQAQHEDATR